LIHNEPFTDRLLMAAGAFILAATAAFFQSGVEHLERWSMRHGSEEVGARILYQGLDLSLVVTLTWTAKS
jgi:hypothetical protein